MLSYSIVPSAVRLKLKTQYRCTKSSVRIGCGNFWVSDGIVHHKYTGCFVFLEQQMHLKKIMRRFFPSRSFYLNSFYSFLCSFLLRENPSFGSFQVLRSFIIICYRVFTKYCVFSKNSKKFASSPSPTIGCYYLYKILPANCTLALRWELWRSLTAM